MWGKGRHCLLLYILSKFSILIQGDPLIKGSAHLGFNCDIKSNLEYKQFSLLEIGTCTNISKTFVRNFTKKAQLIQKRKTKQIPVLQCSLRISLFTSYCSKDFFSGTRNWDGQPAITDVQIRLIKSECAKALADNVLRYQDMTYFGSLSMIDIELPPSGSRSGWKLLRGEKYPTSGTCKAESFSIANVVYPSHTLTMHYHIQIRYQDGLINLRQNVMKIGENLVITNLEQKSLFDNSFGNFHWNYQNSNLTENDWVEITRGKAHFYTSSLHNTQSISIVETQNSSLAMALDIENKLCLFHSCRTSYETSTHNVILVFHDLGQNYWQLDSAGASEISMLTEIQSKTNSLFISQEINLNEAFDKISMLLCQQSRKNIQSSIESFLSNSNNNPDKHHITHRQGSVIYLFKCRKEIIWLAPTNSSTCYEYPKIFYKTNQTTKSAFLDPVSSVIKASSKRIPCSEILQYKIGLRGMDLEVQWYCKSSGGWSAECMEPNQINPMQPGKLYNTQMETIHANLYSPDQLEILQNAQWLDEDNTVLIDKFANVVHRIQLDEQYNIEEIIGALLSKRNLFLSGFSFQTIVDDLKSWAQNLLCIWYLLYIIVNFIPTMKEAYKQKQNKNIGLAICIIAIKILFPISINKKHDCPCKHEIFKDKLYEYVENKEREKFLKNLQF